MQRTIIFLDKKDKIIGWKFGMPNEPHLKILISVFTKSYK
jgi:hypothetical protein